jgi:hypothetical protein
MAIKVGAQGVANGGTETPLLCCLRSTLKLGASTIANSNTPLLRCYHGLKNLSISSARSDPIQLMGNFPNRPGAFRAEVLQSEERHRLSYAGSCYSLLVLFGN